MTAGGPAPATSRRLGRLYRIAQRLGQAGRFDDATAVVAYAQAIADGATGYRPNGVRRCAKVSAPRQNG